MADQLCENLPRSRPAGANHALLRSGMRFLDALRQVAAEELGKATAGQADAALGRESSGRLESIERRLDVLDAQGDVLANMSRELSTLTPQYFERYMLSPLVARLARAIGLLLTTSQQWRNNPARRTGRTAQALDAVAAELTDLLKDYGVEIIDEPAGATFDPQQMEASNSPGQPTFGSTLIVERSLRAGFRLGERTIKPQIVEVRWTDARVAGARQ